MFGIGTEELVLILVIALVVLGPERMPKLARDLGRMVADFRRTSDELRNEFLNADSIIDVAAKSGSAPAAIAAADPPAASDTAPPPLDGGVPLSAESLLVPDGIPPATEAEVVTAPPIPPQPDETDFDREAREARARLRDPGRARQAAAEGWKTPADEAGTTDRWG